MGELEQLIENIKESNPPVHLWKPEAKGEIDIHVDTEGEWFHLGDSIVRERLVKLFSSILWQEDREHFLVTPVEQLKIQVDDVPFIVVDAEYVEQHWMVTTNLGNKAMLGEDHKVELRPYRGQLLPYINIRYDLWARVGRNVYTYWLNEAMKMCDSETELSLSSGDYSFFIAKMEDA